ncbi:hypothetical protein PR048_026105 [Dryococelus australis]|uniref:Uncharacterized protein n=1 Tax=Dryococelus australis TaxID=614101 RepID=A0ABQ9GKF8_9NEOP|nr:hypothetical protein PR048_026105 [Dryococelus australis]
MGIWQLSRNTALKKKCAGVEEAKRKIVEQFQPSVIFVTPSIGKFPELDKKVVEYIRELQNSECSISLGMAQCKVLEVLHIQNILHAQLKEVLTG